MTSIELLFENKGKLPLKNIRLGEKMLPQGMTLCEFQQIDLLEPEKTSTAVLGIDFKESTQGAKLEFLWETELDAKKQMVTISAPVGELIRPVTMSEARFISEQGKLRGMNEHEGKTFVNKTLAPTAATTSRSSLVHRVYETGNLLQVPSIEDHLLRFAGQSLSTQTLILLTIHLSEEEQPSGDSPLSIRIVVNCDKIVIGSMLLQELKEALK